MYGRENLSIRWVANGYECGNLDRNQAGEVMNRMERRIKRQSNVIKKLHEILDGNWEFWQKANAELEQKFTVINAEQNKRIKGLEEDLEQANRLVAVLEASQPKWISVVERLPTKEDADVDGDVLASNRLYPRGLFCHYEDINRLGITHWLSNLQPPTTEKSSSVEEG